MSSWAVRVLLIKLLHILCSIEHVIFVPSTSYTVSGPREFPVAFVAFTQTICLGEQSLLQPNPVLVAWVRLLSCDSVLTD